MRTENLIILCAFLFLCVLTVALTIDEVAKAQIKTKVTVKENNCNICLKFCETASEKEWRLAQDEIWAGWEKVIQAENNLNK